MSPIEPIWTDLDQLRLDTSMLDAVIDEISGRDIRVGEHWLIDFASCNYLGLDLDHEIMSSIEGHVRRWGTHPSWSRLLGSPRLYIEIEERLTDLLGAPDTLALPTVTLIHMSVIPVLAESGTILLNRSAHRTIWDACVLARGQGTRVHRFAGLDQAEQLLRTSAKPRLICTDGVDSMTGNVADLAGLARLCREHDALLYVDDAHGFGVIGERSPQELSPYGRRGNAAIRHLGESYDNVILVAGLSKAYSSLLAFIAVPTPLKNMLKVAAAPYLYSGPSPIASLATVLAGLAVNEARGDLLRAHLYALTDRVLTQVRRLGLATPNTSGLPIIELPLAPGRELADVAALLWRRGIYVTLAPYPMVPRDRVGFRIQLTSAHTYAQIDHLNEVLAELAAAGDLATAESAMAESAMAEPAMAESAMAESAAARPATVDAGLGSSSPVPGPADVRSAQPC